MMAPIIHTKKDFALISLFGLNLAASIYYLIQIIKIPLVFHQVPLFSIVLFGLTLTYFMGLFRYGKQITWYILLTGCYPVGSHLFDAYLEFRWFSIHGTLAEAFLALLWFNAWVINSNFVIKHYQKLNETSRYNMIVFLVITLGLVLYLGWNNYLTILNVSF
jgi:hypothetical protein